ncbi:MAG: DNA methyltransferase [Candidatus Bathyarchaeia archaeon]
MLEEKLTTTQNIDLNFTGKNTTTLTHNFHSYPAKFIPQLAEWMIKRYSEKGDKVLDPMMGCGTALVEARLCKRHGFGLDIDPLALLIATVKTTPIEHERLDREFSGGKDSLLTKLHSDFRKITEKRSKVILPTLFSEENSLLNIQIPDFYRRDELFQATVLEELATIKTRIDEISDLEVRNFCLVAFSAIIKTVSNCDPRDIEPKLPPPERKRLDKPDTLKVFESKLKSMRTRMHAFERLCDSLGCADKSWQPQLFLGDARNPPSDITGINLIVTSPPYANSVDYPRIHKLSFYWLGFATSENLPNLARKYVGTDLITKRTYPEVHCFGIPELDAPLNDIVEKDEKRARVISAYFENMKSCLEKYYEALQDGGTCCLVIGASCIKNVLVPTHALLRKIGMQIGFTFVESIERTIDPRRKQNANAPNEFGGGAINREYILVFRK